MMPLPLILPVSPSPELNTITLWVPVCSTNFMIFTNTWFSSVKPAITSLFEMR